MTLHVSRWPRPTRAGWSTLAIACGLLAAGVNTGNNLFYLLFSLLVATLLTNQLVAGHCLRALRLGMTLPSRAAAGQVSTLQTQVHNTSRWFPVPFLQWQLSGAASAEVVTPCTDAGQQQAASGSFVARKRGWLEFAAMQTQTAFPFGLVTRRACASLDGARLLVHPRLAHDGDVWCVPDERAAGELARTGKGTASARGDVREYAPGDDTRRIDWRLSARTDQLMWRERESERAPTVMIELDRTESSRFERRVSRVAGMALSELARGKSVGIVSKEVIVPAGSGARHRQRLLDGLALVEPSS